MGASVAQKRQRRSGAEYPSSEIGEIVACRGSNLSSGGLVGDRTSLVTDVFFNVMKGSSAAIVPTRGSAAIGVASGTHRVVGSACPLSLLRRGARSVMTADVGGVRPEEYATGDGRSVLSSGV